jgi:FtsP/CotA-like multicopper oxidase with cupredoxin domain
MASSRGEGGLLAQGHGGWRHPIHIHLIDFLVLRRTGGDKDQWNDWDILTQVWRP